MKPLKQAVREHLERRQLSNEQLTTLMAMQKDQAAPDQRCPSPHPSPWHSSWQARSFGAVAAAMVAAIAVWLSLPSVDMPQQIAAEVARNHLNLKPLEVRTSDMDEIRRYFDRLAFKPVNSRLVADAGLRMIGGRYCSIQGIDAAQLRMLPAEGDEIQTVYQTVYDPELFKDLPRLENGDTPVDVTIKGLKVRVWVEKGVLFAMTLSDD
jgi:anti-sigma factor RsiW